MSLTSLPHHVLGEIVKYVSDEQLFVRSTSRAFNTAVLLTGCRPTSIAAAACSLARVHYVIDSYQDLPGILEQIAQYAAGIPQRSDIITFVHQRMYSIPWEASYEAGFSGDSSTIDTILAIQKLPEAVCDGAAAAGRLPIIRYIHEKGCNSYPFEAIASAGKLDLLQWAMAQQIAAPRSTRIMAFSKIVYIAALYGHLDMVKWLSTQRGPLTGFHKDAALLFALQKDQYDMVAWLHSQGAALPDTAFTTASMYGSIPMLEFLQTNGCVITPMSLSYAALSGKLEAVQWLYAHGCPMDRLIVNYSIRHNHLHILHWALEAGVPWTTTGRSPFIYALGYNNITYEMVKYMFDNHCPLPSTPQDLSSHLGVHSDIRILELCLAHGFVSSFSSTAFRTGNLPIIKYYRTVRPVMQVRTFNYLLQDCLFYFDVFAYPIFLLFNM